MFRFGQNGVIGVDIGSAAVKIVQLLRDNGTWTVTAAGVVDIPRAAAGHQGRKETNVVRALRSCLRSTGIQTRMAVCGVSGQDVAVRSFRFPPLSQEDMEGAVLLEASQICPFNIDESAVSYQVISNDKNVVTGVLAAATNELVEKKKRCAENASLEAVLMDVDGLALLNCFVETEKFDPRRTLAILNVGDSYANLAIMGTNSLPFVRDIACPGSEIAAQVAEEPQFSTPAPQTSTAGNRNPAWPDLSGALQEAFQRLVADVNETLRYYAAREKATFVEKIFVCGGLTLFEGFVEWLGGQLATRTALWNPFEKIPRPGRQSGRDILREKGPAMAVAAGLAMRSI
jgi:type IV pilus assembly protein PilM